MMGVPVARILGIEVRLQLGWIIVVAFVAVLASLQVAAAKPLMEPILQWLLGATIAAGFFASAVIHDLSHAILARRRGIEVRSIVVSFFGGATPFDPTSDVAADDLAIAAAGPLVSIAIGGGLVIAAFGTATAEPGGGSGLAEVLGILGILNLLLGFVNVIPAYPLDGGRIVRAIAWRRTGDVKDGWRAAGASGRIVGLTVIAIGAGVLLFTEFTTGAMIALSGWFLVLSARAIRERIKVDDMIGGLTVGDVMEGDTPTVHPGLTVDTFAAQLLDGDVPTSAIPVLSDDRVVGILGARQVKKLRPDSWPTTRVEDVMVKPPRLPIVQPGDGLISAVERLQRAGLDGVPVVADDQLVGVLTRRSIGRAVQTRAATGGGAAATGDPGGGAAADRDGGDERAPS